RIVDDCQRLSPPAQEALFHQFDAMMQAPVSALVGFGDEPPARLPVMPELASRLGWGMVFCLEPLADYELQAALGQASRERGLTIGDEVWGYLLRHTPRDMVGLKSILDGLDRLSLERKRPVTLPLLRTLLQQSGDRLPAADAR
ncbi:MAG: DnaA/Hda family protein, partial [Lautropia sp.]